MLSSAAACASTQLTCVAQLSGVGSSSAGLGFTHIAGILTSPNEWSPDCGHLRGTLSLERERSRGYLAQLPSNPSRVPQVSLQNSSRSSHKP